MAAIAPPFNRRKNPARDAKKNEADAAAISYYEKKAALYRSQKQHIEQRNFLMGYFENMMPQKASIALMNKTLFRAFVELYEWTLTPKNVCNAKARSLADGDDGRALKCDDSLEDEVLAAKRFLRKKAQDKARARTYARAAANKQEVIVIDDDDDDDVVMVNAPAAAANPRVPAQPEMGEVMCSICACETPQREALQCKGPKGHWFCHECFHNLAKSSAGDAEARVRCPHKQEACSVLFSAEQFGFLNEKWLGGGANPLYEPSLYRRLRDAEEDDQLDRAAAHCARCPFCRYREEHPPVRADAEFVCRNSAECGRTSCRLCRKEAHAGQTCEEAEELALTMNKEKLRNLLNEDMTSAVTRVCQKCNAPFYLGESCNKMICHCGHQQCYICHRPLIPEDFAGTPEERRKKAYGHFRARPGARSAPCTLWTSNIDLFHCRERMRSLQTSADRVVARYPRVDRGALAEVAAELLEQEKRLEREQLEKEEEADRAYAELRARFI